MTGKKLTDHPTDKVISEKKQSYPKYQIKNRRAILPNILPFQPQTLRVIDLQYFYFQYLAEASTCSSALRTFSYSRLAWASSRMQGIRPASSPISSPVCSLST